MFGDKNNKTPTPLWVIEARKRLPIIIGIGILFTLYLGGIIAQMTGSITGEYEFSFGIIHCVLANFKIGFHGVFMMLVLYAALVYWFVLRYKDKMSRTGETDDRGFEMDDSGTYGTASLMNTEEARNYVEVETLDKTSGFILGKFITDEKTAGLDKIVSVPPDGKRWAYDSFGNPIMTTNADGEKVQAREKLGFNGNRHIMVIGPSGCGKSYCYSRPNIFQSILHGESVVVTDPKGELYSDTSQFAKKHGYIVRIFNLFWPPGSDGVDFLGLVQGEQIGIEAQAFANIVIQNTENPGGGGDAAYTNGEKNLLTALVLFILTAPSHVKDLCYSDNPEERPDRNRPPTLGDVYELLCKPIEELAPAFEKLKEVQPDNASLGPWGIFNGASDSFKGNLRTGLGNRLTILSDAVIKNVTGSPDIDLVLPGKEKCIYYVIMDDMKDTFKFLSSLFFTYLINKLVEYSRQQPGLRLKVPVNIIMDEFIAIGRLPDFEKKLATVRSAGISVSMIFQNKPQLDAAYPDGLSDTMIGNCSTLLCLACNDAETAKYLSDRSGTATIALDSERVSRPVVPLGTVPTEVAHSYSLGQRAILNLDEVIRMPPSKVLIAITSANLFLADKFPYTDIVNPDDLEQVNMYDHVPQWREKEGNISIGKDEDEDEDEKQSNAGKNASHQSSRPSIIPPSPLMPDKTPDKPVHSDSEPSGSRKKIATPKQPTNDNIQDKGESDCGNENDAEEDDEVFDLDEF